MTLSKTAILNRKRRDNGLCARCGKPSTVYFCRDCKDKRNESYKKKQKRYLSKSQKIKRREWKEQNLCVRCGNIPLKNKSYCENHLLKKTALKQLGSNKYSEQLKQLLINQNYKCALTGRSISLEDEIEIDHIIPTCRGGTKTIDNVRWVIKDANRLKGYYLDEEMMPIAIDILLNNGYSVQNKL